MSNRPIFEGLLGRKVLITGAAGFIGSHLVERLAGLGSHVTAAGSAASFALGNLSSVGNNVTRQVVDLVNDDLEAFLAVERFDLIFHLSASAHVASSVDDPRRDFQGNALATLNLIDAVRRVSPSTALLYTSSAVVYEGGGKDLIREEGPTNPRSPYGVSKLAAEQYVSVFSRLYGMRTAVLRLFSVFGPRLRKQIVFDLMGRLMNDPSSLTMRGSGEEKRDFSYVDDVVEAILTVADRGPLAGEAYNVASGEMVSTLRLARLIALTMGIEPDFRFSGSIEVGDTPHWFADTSRLRALGHVPRVDLATGLERTWDWRQRTGDVAEPAKLAP